MKLSTDKKLAGMLCPVIRADKDIFDVNVARL